MSGRWKVAGAPPTPRARPASGPPTASDTGGRRLLRSLHGVGIEHVFANAGSDVPAILEAFAGAAAEGWPAPRPIQVPHEGCAVAMGHGWSLATGRPTAALVHSTVGTGNALTGIINASRNEVPLLLMAGRTASVVRGVAVPRTLEPHWAQEIPDQGSLVRPYVKWDYELRSLAQIDQVVRRAVAVAMSEPKGPVYLALPMDLMSEPAGPAEPDRPTVPLGSQDPGAAFGATTTPQPEPAALARVADALAGAENPLLITRNFGRRPEAVPALVELAEAVGLPVIEYQIAQFVNFPWSHPLHLGYNPGPYLPEADVVVVLDCPVPWVPALTGPGPDARVVHLGIDPLRERYPIFGFPSDLAVAGDPLTAVRELTQLVAGRPRPDNRVPRIERLRREHDRQRAAWRVKAEAAGRRETASAAWISHCLRKHLSPDLLVVQEYDLKLDLIGFDRPGSYFGFSPSGGLGFGVGGALGVKLAHPDKTVVSVVGDGTYYLGVPSAAHFVSQAQDLPVLWIVVNNHGWGAIRVSALQPYPRGYAARADQVPVTRFGYDTRFELFAEACGGSGRYVARAADVPGALDWAFHTLRATGRQVLLNVNCGEPDFSL